MLRSDHVALLDIMRNTVRGTLAQMPRGYMQTDTAAFQAGYGYAYADGAFLGTIFGIKLTRLASLGNGHRDYYNEAGALQYST